MWLSDSVVLAQYDAAIERFPTEAYPSNGRAETLRALGRLTDALAQYDATIERFPADAVAYNGRAETLRALGLLNHALVQYDAAIERFPNSPYARCGRSYILILKGEFAAAREALHLLSKRVTADDWVAEHMLGIADLHEGMHEVAIRRFALGAEMCPFAVQKKTFLTALSVARLRKARQDNVEIEKAESDLEKLKPVMTLPTERGVVLLLSAHVAAAKKDRSRAEEFIQEARTVISLHDVAPRRLERELVGRFQLFRQNPQPLSKPDEDKLDDAVFDAEFQLLAA